MEATLNDEKKELLKTFVDELPTTPGLNKEETQILDTVSEHIASNPVSFSWLTLEVLAQLLEMWNVRFKGTIVDFMALQTLLRRLFRHRSKVVLGLYEILHRQVTEHEDGQENQIDLYQFQYHHDNAMAAIRYHKELLGEPMEEWFDEEPIETLP